MCTDETVCSLLLSRVTLAKNALAPLQIIFLAFSVKLSPEGSLRVTIQISQSIRAQFSPSQSIPKMTSKSYKLNTINAASMTRPDTVTLPPLTLWEAINSSWARVDTDRMISMGSFSRCANSTNFSDTNDCVEPESNNTKAKWPKMGSVPVTTASNASACLPVVAWAIARPCCCWAPPTPLILYCRIG